MKIAVRLIFIFTLIVLCYLFLFKDLGEHHVHIWDEARYGNNSIEMLKTNDFIVTYYRPGLSDWYNTKPPLLNWLQYLSFKLFGINEFALRLPSAVAGSLTLLIIFLFCDKILRIQTVGFVTSLVLLSLVSFNGYHVCKTGDTDALLVLFSTCYGLLFYYMYQKNHWRKDLMLLAFSVLILLALYTKSVAGGIPLIGIVMFLILEKKILYILKIPKIYFYALGVITLFGGYYILREHYDPGYISSGLGVDLNLYTKESGWKDKPFLYYFRNLYELRFYPYIYITPIIIFALVVDSSSIIGNFNKFSIVFGVTFLIIHSFADTNNFWYDAPAIPFIAISTVTSTWILIERSEQFIKYPSGILKHLILISIFVVLSFFAFDKNDKYHAYKPEKRVYKMERLGYDMKNIIRLFPEYTDFKVYTYLIPNHAEVIQFYANKYNIENDYNLKIVRKHHLLNNNPVLVEKNSDEIENLLTEYEVDTIYSASHSLLIRLHPN